MIREYVPEISGNFFKFENGSRPRADQADDPWKAGTRTPTTKRERHESNQILVSIQYLRPKTKLKFILRKSVHLEFLSKIVSITLIKTILGRKTNILVRNIFTQFHVEE